MERPFNLAPSIFRKGEAKGTYLKLCTRTDMISKYYFDEQSWP